MKYAIRKIAFLIIVVVSFILVCWLVREPRLNLIATHLIKFNSALCALFGALSVFYYSSKKSRYSLWIPRIFGLVCGLFGLATLIEIIYSIDLGIDEFMVRDISVTLESARSPGRMSPQSALLYTLLGFSLLSIPSKNKMMRGLGQQASLAMILISLLSFIGHVFQQTFFYQIGGFPAVPLATVIFSFLLGSCAFLLNPPPGIARILLSGSNGSFFSRRLLVVSTAVPLVLGWLVLQGLHLGMYSSTMSISIFVLMIIILFIGFVLQNAEAADVNSSRLKTLNLERIKVLAEMNALFSGAPVAICYLDPHLRFLRMNSSFETMFELKESSYYGKTFSEVMHEWPDAARSFHEVASRVLSTGKLIKNLEVKGHHHGQKTLFWLVNAYPVLLPEAGVMGVGAAIVDVTALKAAERSLALSRELLERERLRLRAVIQNMPTGLMMIDANSADLSLVNPQASMIFGLELSTLKEFHQHIMGYDQNGKEVEPSGWPLVRALRQGVTLQDDEITIRREDGVELTLSMNATPIRDEDGKIISAICIFYDVTEKKKSERELVAARDAAEASSRAKTSFLANMSHEIRTPIGAIMGFSEIMQDPALDESELSNYSAIIRRNSRQLLHLIDDILDLSKVESGQFIVEKMAIQTRQLIEEVVTLFSEKAHEKNIELRLTSTSEIPDTILSDPIRLRQILINIIGNAVKFTDHGFVQIHYSYQRSEEILRIEVKDTGLGIPQEVRRMIFEPFTQADASTTRKFGGTGLGLALSRRLARALGGDVDLVNRDGDSGSTFVISIHAAVQPSPMILKKSDRPPQQTMRSTRLQGTKVLIVDDAPDNQALIGRFLKLAGAEVVIASNGAEAIDMALGDDSIDVVVMDIQMPVLDGYSATRTLRDRGYQKPILALTAHAFAEERERCLASGCNDYLTKPVDRLTLEMKIDEYVNMAAHRNESSPPSLEH